MTSNNNKNNIKNGTFQSTVNFGRRIDVIIGVPGSMAVTQLVKKEEEDEDGIKLKKIAKFVVIFLFV